MGARAVIQAARDLGRVPLGLGADGGLRGQRLVGQIQDGANPLDQLCLSGKFVGGHGRGNGTRASPP